MRKTKRFPDEFKATFKVEVVDTTAKTAKGIDGREQTQWFESGGFDQSTIYDGSMVRRDGTFVLSMVWVDLDNGKRIKEHFMGNVHD